MKPLGHHNSVAALNRDATDGSHHAQSALGFTRYAAPSVLTQAALSLWASPAKPRGPRRTPGRAVVRCVLHSCGSVLEARESHADRASGAQRVLAQ